MTHNVVSRLAWQPRLRLGPAMPGIPTEVWLHHTVTIADDNHDLLAHEDAYADMLEIERVGKQRFGRFPYSWCYHPPDRLWLEGAGNTIGAHTHGHNSKGLGLAVIGNTNTDDIPHFAEDCADHIAWLRTTGRLADGPTYPSGGHRDLKATACPGSAAYAAIPTIRQYLQEDDMFTETDRRKLNEIHDELFTSAPDDLNELGHSTKAGTLRWRLTKILERTADLTTGRRPEGR